MTAILVIGGIFVLIVLGLFKGRQAEAAPEPDPMNHIDCIENGWPAPDAWMEEHQHQQDIHHDPDPDPVDSRY